MEEVHGEPGPFDLCVDLPDNRKKKILINQPEVNSTNAIKEELQAFHHSIVTNSIPIVPLEDGYNALKVANTILEKLGSVSALS